MSAILSALALGGVAWSLRLQALETRAQRRESQRTTHAQILSIALNDPDLLTSYPMRAGEVADYKRYYYLNLFFQWWRDLHSAGQISDDVLRREFDVVLRGDAGRRYVRMNRDLRSDDATRTAPRFFQILEESLARAEATGPALPIAIAEEKVDTAKRGVNLGRAAVVVIAASAIAGWLAGRRTGTGCRGGKATFAASAEVLIWCEDRGLSNWP